MKFKELFEINYDLENFINSIKENKFIKIPEWLFKHFGGYYVFIGKTYHTSINSERFNWYITSNKNIDSNSLNLKSIAMGKSTGFYSFNAATRDFEKYLIEKEKIIK